jgi:hypothetical protein
MDDLDSRVSDLEGIDADAQLSDHEDRLSALESFKDAMCASAPLSDISDINDLAVGC